MRPTLSPLFTILLLVCICICFVSSATIFDGRNRLGRRAGMSKPSPTNAFSERLTARLKKLEKDDSKRHINTFRVLDSEEADDLARRMEDKTQKFNDDTSNERNIWRSHPQKPDFEGPDTASVAGLGFE